MFRVSQAADGGLAVQYASFAHPVLTLMPPTADELAAQLKYLRTAADLRADRLAEIVAQQSDLPDFFAAQFFLTPERKKWTLVLMEALYDAVVLPEMRLKFFVSAPRPIDFSTQVQPVLPTPPHSAYPSGHATESFAFATLLQLLNLAAGGEAAPVSRLVTQLTGGGSVTDLMPFRLAARIADNRTVAGVHFPVDSAHGALLGLSCGLAFAAAALPGRTELPTWQAKAADWTTDFTLGRWTKALTDGGWHVTAASGTLATGNSGAPRSLLGQLWDHAVAEWKLDL